MTETDEPLNDAEGAPRSAYGTPRNEESEPRKINYQKTSVDACEHSDCCARLADAPTHSL